VHTDTRTSAPAPARARASGVALMVGSGLASQTGAATGALAFDVIGPVGVVAVRQWVAGVVLLAVGGRDCGRSPGGSGTRCSGSPPRSPS
jgi:inner membrane transporter RhtA